MPEQQLEESICRLPYILDMLSSKVTPWPAVLSEELTDQKRIWETGQLVEALVSTSGETTSAKVLAYLSTTASLQQLTCFFDSLVA